MSFIYSILPEYTKNIDIFYDYNNSGEVKSLEGFTEAIDVEVFDILSNTIREITDFTDIYKLKTEYLPYFSYLLGYKWNYYIDTDIQKNIVSNILQLYKRKGTKFAFHFGLYHVDSNIEIYEPYKDIFIVGKSKLNTKHFSSRNYYSYGVIVLKVYNLIPEIFEIMESVRPAGWKIIMEGIYNLFYNLHLKPFSEIREYYIQNTYKLVNPDDEEEIQYINSIQYINNDIIPIVMMGTTFMVISNWTLNDLQHISIVEPNINLNYYTMWRNPYVYTSYNQEALLPT